MEKTAIQIVKAFQDAGYQAYFAGGSVRDMLMEKEPGDYDIAVSATPDQIESIIHSFFSADNNPRLQGGEKPKVIPIGKQFGVMLGIVNGHEFEIATFRSDSSYSDGRRPDAVIFTTPEEDAVRRDFTINGLFYDPIQKKVLDFVDGQKDIQKKIIRFIGEPHERIKEDHLRLLRAIRFKNNFSFSYDLKTKEAISELGHLIEGVSWERIQDELTKILLHPHRSHALRELDDFGMLEILIPELTACKGVKQPTQYHQEGDVLTHILKALHELPEEWASKELVWAILLHDIGKPDTFEKKTDRIHFDGHAEYSAKMARVVLKRLKFSKAEITKITWLIEHHMTVGFIPEMKRAHQVGYFWHPFFEDLMKLHWCDESGSVPVDLSLYDKIMTLYHEFKDEKLLEDHFKPLLTGDEVIELLKIKPGPKVKEIIQALREEQIEGGVKTKEEAKEFIAKFNF